MGEISFENVSKTYADGTEAVSGVSLCIPDGRLHVLVGPSGCGKTTLLRMVAGLEDITTGQIRIDGVVANDIPPKKRDVAVVFQDYALYPHMTVFENMAFALRLRRRGKDDIQRRVVLVSQMLGVADQLRKKPAGLSGGQRQRVAMGRAVVREPQAFLMDEPLSNLDAKLRVDMRSEIGRLQKELGVTTIFVTHDQTEAMVLGDSVAVLRQGVLQQVDEPQTLYREPANLFVAGFIGSPGMNIVSARVALVGTDVFAEFGDQRLCVDRELVARKPALRSYGGKEVALGIRPEHIRDAAFARGDTAADARLFAIADLREELGPETYVYFTVTASPVLTDETKDLAEDTDAVSVEALERRVRERRMQFVARMDPDTKIRAGERIKLAVDTRRLHFFDPATGQTI